MVNLLYILQILDLLVIVLTSGSSIYPQHTSSVDDEYGKNIVSNNSNALFQLHSSHDLTLI